MCRLRVCAPHATIKPHYFHVTSNPTPRYLFRVNRSNCTGQPRESRISRFPVKQLPSSFRCAPVSRSRAEDSKLFYIGDAPTRKDSHVIVVYVSRATKFRTISCATRALSYSLPRTYPRMLTSAGKKLQRERASKRARELVVYIFPRSVFSSAGKRSVPHGGPLILPSIEPATKP